MEFSLFKCSFSNTISKINCIKLRCCCELSTNWWWSYIKFVIWKVTSVCVCNNKREHETKTFTCSSPYIMNLWARLPHIYDTWKWHHSAPLLFYYYVYAFICCCCKFIDFFRWPLEVWEITIYREKCCTKRNIVIYAACSCLNMT